MRVLAVFAVSAALGGAWLVKHRHRAAGAREDPAAVLACLQASHLTASATTSSSGVPQIEVEHGSGRISPNTTLVDTQTDIAFFDSEASAAWWESGLRQAPGADAGSVTHVENAVVVWGTTATAAERSAIAACVRSQDVGAVSA
jgi:hypothetical protein